jgi:hypothetical protein
LTISKFFIPLIAIGKKYYQLLDDQSNGIDFTIEQKDLDSILDELSHWRMLQQELEPVPETPVSYLNMYSFWDSYILMTYDFLSLVILSKKFATKIESAELHDPTLSSAYHHATHTGKLIRGQLMHNPKFDNMPVLTGKCIFISGVYLCAFGHRIPEVISTVQDHITALRAIAEYASKAYVAVADQLAMFMSEPSAAIQFIQTSL